MLNLKYKVLLLNKISYNSMGKAEQVQKIGNSNNNTLNSKISYLDNNKYINKTNIIMQKIQ